MSEAMHMHALAQSFLDQAGKSDTTAPSPEAFEEGALGSAVVALLSASEARCATADKLAAILGAIVIVARHEGATRKQTLAVVTARFNRMWRLEETIAAMARRSAN